MASHLTIEERDRTSQLWHQGTEQKEIALTIRRSAATITFDNGTEFARCHRLEKHLGLELYFADPGSSYQRGTNENTNGFIRQFFPKGTDFRDTSHHQVRRVEMLLNNRPRAYLGFRTPDEVFFEKRTTPSFVVVFFIQSS